jgi:hypothetical protein
LTSSGFAGPLNGTVGATTPAAGAFTTVSASGNVTLSGGTANGVTYLNGSKVVTSGSALTYNGSNLINTNGYISTSGDFRLGNATFSRVAVGDGGGGFVGGYNITYSGGPVYDSTGAISGIYNANGGNIQFYAGGSASAGTAAPEQMRLTSTGLGIGTSSPSAKLHVSGGASYITGASNGTAQLQFFNNAQTTSGFQVGQGYASNTDNIGYVYNTANAAIAFGTNNTERMRIDSSGNVGIGTTSVTSSRVQIKGVNNTTNAYADGLKVTSNNETINCNYSWAGIDANDTLKLATAGTERMRIDSSGRLLVGTTAPISAFADKYRVLINPYTNSTTQYGLMVSANANSYTQYAAVFADTYSETIVGSIRFTTSATSYVTSSDYRLKHDIEPMTGALAKVALLKPCTYKWNIDGSNGDGFIAHELAEVVPQCVTGEKDAVDAEGKPQYQGIDTSFLVATLTAAIQEQQALIQDLTTRLAALESKA